MFLSVAVMVLADTGTARAQGMENCVPVHDAVNKADGRTSANGYGRTLCADVVALDQMLVYNRFGSFNPYGMIYALRRDVVRVDQAPSAITADACDEDPGIALPVADMKPGQVRLRDCKRARPMVLRANAGDILHLRLQNLLREQAPDMSATYCPAGKDEAVATGNFGSLYHRIRNWVSEGSESQVAHGERLCQSRPAGSPGNAAEASDWPASRGLNFGIQGLTAFGMDRAGNTTSPDRACLGLRAIAPGDSVDCYYRADQEGPFFMASTAAPSGGEGDGGSITHGLFGAVVVEPAGSKWYRSQVSKKTFDTVWSAARLRHSRTDLGALDSYDLTDNGQPTGLPYLNMLQLHVTNAHEIVHSDLNAIIYEPASEKEKKQDAAFREFSVFFHDELKSFYTRNYEELGDFAAGQLSGVRDGFAINYGASGMGDMLLANRKGIGPAANCAECLYEEFFLTSWANGDPALLEQFSDDPSNVHHSYLNDPVVFRNFHAGPKETHVFHLHAHQWFAGNDANRGAYLDSQTVAPQQGFSYNIYGGGLEVYHKGQPGEGGWYEQLGSGNRNRTPGDSIFHCHLYPHFAQGMWELWRVHDVLEDGTRKLPDGQWEANLSLAEMDADTRKKKRPGSVDQQTGRWISSENGVASQVGTPVPALVPLPGQPWPLLPTYPDEDAVLLADGTVKATGNALIDTFAGYPFYIDGDPGHRPPQAPMDIARQLNGDDVTDEYLDGGLPRHVVTDNATRAFPFTVPALPPLASPVTSLADALAPTAREAQQAQIVAKALALGDLTMKLKTAEIKLLDYNGSPIERTGMGFHHNGKVYDDANNSTTDLRLFSATGAPTKYQPGKGGYGSPGGSTLLADPLVLVNSSAPKPGAPFADPCGAPKGMGTVQRQPGGDYVFRVGVTAYPLWASDAAGLPGSVNPLTAGDSDVANWVHWRRDDKNPHGRKHLYYKKGGSVVPIALPPLTVEQEPFLSGLTGTDLEFVADPGVIGYRRYEGSAVQVDLVTNRAGWHDPQGRINVLSVNSGNYKDGNGRISPKVSASEEPFFFRALSGECIEFRHTNELPKDLELDDFQVRTPTDTIGQHIHLVKFDVTSSDGSGNGFNYEDGTLAADEIAARICAAKNVPSSAADIVGARPPGALRIRESAIVDGVSSTPLCELRPPDDDPSGKEYWQVAKQYYGQIWRLKMQAHRELFQTTTQRWFADPILSATRADGDPAGIGSADRTLRTVFSHDHFGPSSIQQHGFYTALVIEAQEAQFCGADNLNCTPPRLDRSLVNATDQDVGARKIIIDRLPLTDPTHLHPDAYSIAEFREYALAIADFATLYDPRRSMTPEQVDKILTTEALADADLVRMKGMMTLLCEAQHATDPLRLKDLCGSAMETDSSGNWYGAPGDVAPAWVAAGMAGDDPAHSADLAGNLLTDAEIAELKEHLIHWRQMAAGHAAGSGGQMAGPVAPPARPESISVDHHDPYLVNYRGEPLPLRLGKGSSGAGQCAPRSLTDWEGMLQTGVTEDCEISQQRVSLAGDMANVFLSPVHGDPVTPILDAFDGDPVMIRLIQGAQEVQHTFSLDGYHWTRNMDQSYPMNTPARDDVTPRETLARVCRSSPSIAGGLAVARAGRPEQYRRWLERGPSHFTDPADLDYWTKFEELLGDCFDIEGRKTAQEIGISEHFEFAASYLHDSNLMTVQNGKVPNADPRIRTYLTNANRQLMIARARLLKKVPADTLYHFGSQDAIWNGAWGLLRVHKDSVFTPELRFPKENEDALDRLFRQLEEVNARLLELAEKSLIEGPTPDDLALARRLSDQAIATGREMDALIGNTGGPLRTPVAEGTNPGLSGLIRPDPEKGDMEPPPNFRIPDQLPVPPRPDLNDLITPINFPGDRQPGDLIRGGGLIRTNPLDSLVPGAGTPAVRDLSAPRLTLRDGIVNAQLDPRLLSPDDLDVTPRRPLPGRITADRLVETPVLRFILPEPPIGAEPPDSAEADGIAASPALLNDQDRLIPLADARREADAVADRAARDKGDDQNIARKVFRMLQYKLVPPKYELVAECDPLAPYVHTAIVAIESDKVFGPDARTGQTGTSYSDKLYDENGLFFAIVDPRRLINPADIKSVTPEMIDDPSSWANISLKTIIDAIQSAYGRPEPLVLTVNAGDCVKVTWLNAMQRNLNARQGHRGLADAPGDAPMPGITSLNVDLAWSGPEADGNNPVQRKAMNTQRDLVPSARLAVNIPLPVMNKSYSYGRPIGGNPIWAADGVAKCSAAGHIECDGVLPQPFQDDNTYLSVNDHPWRFFRTRAAEIEQFEFYAGFAVARTEKTLPWLVSGLNPQLVFQLADLRQDLPEGMEKLIIDPENRASIGDYLNKIAEVATGYTQEYARLSTSLRSKGASFQLTPPLATGNFGDLEYVPRQLPPDLVNGDIGRLARSRISYGGSEFAHGIRMTEALDGGVYRDQLVDLETAISSGLTSGALGVEQVRTLQEVLPQIDNRLLQQLDDLSALPGMDDLLALLRRVKVNFIPYAFGALPVKSHADMIGHPTHGLIGAIVVVPQDADIGDVRAPKMRFDLGTDKNDISIRRRYCMLFPVVSGDVAPLDTPLALPRACTERVVVPEKSDTPFWNAAMVVFDAEKQPHNLRQFTLFWQDGLNLRDIDTKDVHDAGSGNEKLVADCLICDDTYDFGDKGISYRAEPFNVRLRRDLNPSGGSESHYNQNQFDFGPNFFTLTPQDLAGLPPMPVLRAQVNEEVVVHVVHPGGRARQRALVTLGQDYDDLFPGFGFPHSALVAPGKAVPASFSRRVREGCYLWFDGPVQLRAGGAWGLLDVVKPDQFGDRSVTSCARP
ncbi:hypothetical protein [Paracoccus sp. (in: a-proteobacteria)]|uniref:hypothetical protein n=1 Tax=Paracoccus sp. TaxID=267 RepID=UPI003A857A54